MKDGAFSVRPPGVFLTPRESEIVRLIGRSYTNAAIADTLGINRKSVENNINHILAKFGSEWPGHHQRVRLALMARGLDPDSDEAA